MPNVMMRLFGLRHNANSLLIDSDGVCRFPKNHIEKQCEFR
jgi:hypothetical protein